MRIRTGAPAVPRVGCGWFQPGLSARGLARRDTLSSHSRRGSPSPMIGTALHGFDAARTARQGMSQARLSRKLRTAQQEQPATGEPCNVQRWHRAAQAAPGICASRRRRQTAIGGSGSICRGGVVPWPRWQLRSNGWPPTGTDMTNA